ncbi:MAG: Ger(x)C family spore germination protein [Dehalobacter sp.]|nr:Ger(x)C family spore germination protein [Dehalobacter sp.]
MRKVFLLLLSVIMLMLSGCGGAKELEEYSFITSVGIDSGPGDGEMTLTVESAIPQSRSAGGNSGKADGSESQIGSGVIYQASEVTLSAALSRLQEITEHEIFLGYVGSVVIGEEAARKDMDRILDFLKGNLELRRSAYIFISKDRAENVLSIIVPRKSLIGVTISSMARDTEETGFSFATRIGDSLFLPLFSTGVQPLIAAVKASDLPEQAAGSPEKTGTQGVVKQKPGYLSLPGMAVFNGTTLVGWLNEKESRGWGWIRGKVKRGYIVRITPRSDTGKLSPVTFHLLDGKSSIKYTIDNNTVSAHIDIKVKGEVREWAESINVIDTDIIRSLEKDLAVEIKSEVQAALEKGQRELKSDIFGFGFELFRQNYRAYNQNFRDKWPVFFPDMPIDVKVEASIQNTGTFMRALEIRTIRK